MKIGWGKCTWMRTYRNDVCLNPSLDISLADSLKLLLCNLDILFLHSQVFVSTQFMNNSVQCGIMTTRSRFMCERHDRFIIRHQQRYAFPIITDPLLCEYLTQLEFACI